MVITFLLAILSSFNSQPAITGTWLIPDENVHVEITCEGDACNGKIVKAAKQEVIGKEVLQELKENKGKWEGKFYAIRKDKLVDVSLKPQGEKMDVEISMGFASKSFIWTRIDE